LYRESNSVGSVYHTGASHWVRRRPPPSPRTSGSVSRAPCSETTHSTRNTAQPKHARYTTAGAGVRGAPRGANGPTPAPCDGSTASGTRCFIVGRFEGKGEGGARARVE
jgi:hypothetical protein